MNRISRSAAVAALTVGIAGVPAASGSAAGLSFGRPQDVRAITTIENDLAVETDTDRAMSYFAGNAILADIMAPGWYQGKKQIRAAIAPQLAALKAIRYHMNEINVATDGKFACAAMVIHFDATKSDNAPLKMTIRQLDAFRKIDGQWRIVQQHLSVPVDEKSGVAIFDTTSPARGDFPWTVPSVEGPPLPVAQAKSQIYAWLAASEVPRSVDEMESFYGPGDDSTIYDFWSPRGLRGRGELHDFYAPQFVGVRDMNIRMPVVSIDTDGALGAEISQQNLTINMKNGTHQRVSFRQSDCVRRVGDKWYAIFEMGSFPVDPKTGKGIMLDKAAFE
jgi:ketosteroid isomerase-like protein